VGLVIVESLGGRGGGVSSVSGGGAVLLPPFPLAPLEQSCTGSIDSIIPRNGHKSTNLQCQQ